MRYVFLVLKNKKLRAISGVFILALAIGAVLAVAGHQPKTEIKSNTQASDLSSGQVVEGRNVGAAAELKTDSTLKYESSEVATNEPNTNGIGVMWDQQGEGENPQLEVRSFDGKEWSQWYTAGSSDDRPDNAPATHTTMVLAKKAQKAQYRFTMNAQNGSSPTISNVRLTAIDATKGPNPTKSTGLGGLINKAKAAVSGPRIYSRTEWGSPQGEYSPDWAPEYRPLYRVVVHHTAGYANPNDSASAVRAIWQYHTYTNGWGDIGYNYLVDLNGNIFQGRAYDKAYAEANNVDVVAGHTFGNNYGTTGISNLGDFTQQQPNNAMLDAIGRIAGWKLMPYGINPSGNTCGTWSGGTTCGAALLGHRDAPDQSTACPGENLYRYLGTIRTIAANYYNLYLGQYKYDYSYQGQGVDGSPGGQVNLQAFQSKTVYLDLKNEGKQAWSNSGANPVRLGTDRPLDRVGGFQAPDWINANRAATFTQKVTIGAGGSKTVTSANTIQPGEIARFTFTMKAPNVNGSYAEYFRPVVEGLTWFTRDLGIFWQVSVVGEKYTSQWLHQSGQVPSTPSTTTPLQLTVRNTGTTTWTNTGDANTIRLATNNPRDRTSLIKGPDWLGFNRVVTFDGRTTLDGNGNPVGDGSGGVAYDSSATSVAPGQAATFVFQVTTPNRPYTGKEYFNLVVDGKAWLNDQGIYWPVNIPQGYASQITNQSVFPTIDKSNNPIGMLYFDYKNTGTFPWKRSDVVSLAPTRPNDRNSIFAALGLTSGQLPSGTQNWLGLNRVGTFMAGKVVNGSVVADGNNQIDPGETGRFAVALDARSVNPGTYREYFRLVADGWAWLEDFGAYQDITVVP